MNSFRKSLLALTLGASAVCQTHASIVISIVANRLEIANGSSPVPAGTLLQLVNLGADGIFNPINLTDGNVSQLGQWVSGDDTLLTIPFMVDSGPGDFPSAAAFDLRKSSLAEPTSGLFTRVFEFDSGSVTNMKLGLRWFPGLQASDFNSITLAAGQAYGEFTRQINPINNGGVWTVGAALDGNFTFDSLSTTEVGGQDLANAGNASLTVVPEPAAIGLSLLGAAGLATLRRRRG